MGANIGFATISVIPSMKGINVRARAGLAVFTKIGKDVGEDTGKRIAKGIEDKVNPDLKRAGAKAGNDLAKGIESGGAPNLTRQGTQAGESFAQGIRRAPSPDLHPPGVEAGNRFSQGLLSGVKEKGKAALILGGVTAAAILSQGLIQGFDQEATTDKLAAQLGGSEWAQGLGEVAGNLYTQAFGDSVADTAAAVRATVLLGLLPEDATNAQIESMSARLLTFTDVLDQDTLPSVRAVATLMRTGLAKNAEEAFDLLTRGIQQGGDLGEDILDTFNEYPTTFREIGLSGADAMGLIIQSLKAGARNSDFVADALKEFSIRGQDASVLSAQGFELIGLNAKQMTRDIAGGGPAARKALDSVLTGLKNMTNPVERNQAAVALFGTKAEDLGDALFAMDLPGAAMNLGTVAGSTDKLSSAYDNAKSRIESFKRDALQVVTEFIGNEVIPRLEDLYTWVQNNESQAKLFGGVLIGVAAALLILTAPITATIIGLAAIAAGLIFAYENSKTFRDGVDNVIQGLESMYGWLVAIKDFWGGFVGQFFGSNGLDTKIKQVQEKVANTKIRGALGNIQERAMGGNVWRNTPYVVGERGPELFVPSASGQIVPNHSMGMAPMGSEGIGMEVVLGFDGSTSDRSIISALAGALRIRPASRKALAA